MTTTVLYMLNFSKSFFLKFNLKSFPRELNEFFSLFKFTIILSKILLNLLLNLLKFFEGQNSFCIKLFYLSFFFIFFGNRIWCWHCSKIWR